ncbi:hypothetical protein H6G76_29295 [Nostoc sp. FACHB-152]|uniref:hypothetical protein n=1 Tax=Nostoc sp. FACHB-152 TaxID=2692837 RepID=UPI00168847F2|nr:hypothetical protein [Nostoc sp. FACHB-152]MBD2451154.1 hypothetical protein [Nostoc sp. FACHB-152]
MKHPKFAQMNEVNISVEESDSEPPKEQKPTERVQTSPLVAYSPLIKMGVIGGGIFMFVGTIGAIINGSLNALNTTNKIEPNKQVAQAEETPVVDEGQKDKTLLALTTQSTALKGLRDRKVKVQATETASPTAQTTPPPTTTAKARTQAITTRSYPTASTTPIRRSPNRTPVPTLVTGGIQQLPVTKPRQSPVSQNKVAIAPTATSRASVDPQQQWLAVAEAGSFSAPKTEPELDKQLANGIEGGTGIAPDSKQQSQEIVTPSNGKRVIVGTIGEGKLETPIVWADSDSSSQNYLIRLTKELKASDGSVVVPVDSYLVVQLTNTNTEGYAQLNASAILVNQNGDTQEKKLPTGAVRILASNGKLLKAQTGRGSNFTNTIFSAALAGVGKAVSLQNSPTSSITTTSNGFTSSSVTGGNRDALAGFGEGAIGSILQDMKAASEQRAQSMGNQKVYAIEAGKTVRIYVNQTISL